MSILSLSLTHLILITLRTNVCNEGKLIFFDDTALLVGEMGGGGGGISFYIVKDGI